MSSTNSLQAKHTPVTLNHATIDSQAANLLDRIPSRAIDIYSKIRLPDIYLRAGASNRHYPKELSPSPAILDQYSSDSKDYLSGRISFSAFYRTFTVILEEIEGCASWLETPPNATALKGNREFSRRALEIALGRQLPQALEVFRKEIQELERVHQELWVENMLGETISKAD